MLAFKYIVNFATYNNFLTEIVKKIDLYVERDLKSGIELSMKFRPLRMAESTYWIIYSWDQAIDQ